ncbi:MAG: AI-2E family transporter, partial [bacterium]
MLRVNSNSIVRTASWLFVFLVFVAFLKYFQNILQPLALAIVIWYMIYEFKRIIGKIKINQWSIPAWLVSIIATIFIFIIVLLIYEIISYNLKLIIERIPYYAKELKVQLDKIEFFEKTIDYKIIIEQIDFAKIGNIGTSVLLAITNVAGDFFMIIIFVISLIVEENMFKTKKRIIKSSSHQKLIRRIARSIRFYLKVKTLVSILTGILSYVVLLLFNVKFALFWAFIIFILNYIPYIGSFIATVLPAIFSALQFNNLLMFVWIFLTIEAIQIIVGSYLEPRIMGNSLNISPLVIILSLSFWASIWGIIGMLIAVPITASSIIILSQFPETKNIA